MTSPSQEQIDKIIKESLYFADEAIKLAWKQATNQERERWQDERKRMAKLLFDKGVTSW